MPSRQLIQRVEVHRRVLADRRVRAPARLHADDPIRGQRLAANEEFHVLAREDVVRDHADLVGVAHPLAQRIHEGRLPRSDRPADANPIRNPDAVAIEIQEEGYPEIAPMALERSATEVFSLVHEAVERLGWNIVASEAPGEAEPGRIEATDRTLVMGFTDDVVVQVKGDDTYAIIDARSVSRYGWHDLGINAQRIQRLFEEITTALEKGEKTALEQAVPKEEAPDNKPAAKKPAKKSAGKKPRASR